MNVRRPHCWLVNIGSGNVLVLISTSVGQDVWRHMASLGRNELNWQCTYSGLDIKHLVYMAIVISIEKYILTARSITACYQYILFNSYSTTLAPGINSLMPSDAIWRQRTGSTLAQVMACCLTAPSHYLNQCLLFISKVLWLSCERNFTRDASRCLNHQSLKSVWKSHVKNFIQISQEPMS